MTVVHAAGIVALAAICGVGLYICNTDDAQLPPPVNPANPSPANPSPGRPAPAEAARPALPDRPAPAAAGSAAALAFPAFRDARELAPPRTTPQLDALVAAWCLPGSIASPTSGGARSNAEGVAGSIDAATQQLAAALTADGFDHVAARGTGERRAISGMRGEARVSISVGGKDQRCDGVVATGTLVRADQQFAPPPLEPGERVR